MHRSWITSRTVIISGLALSCSLAFATACSPEVENTPRHDGAVNDGSATTKRLWPTTLGNQWSYVGHTSQIPTTSVWTVRQTLPASAVIPAVAGDLSEIEITVDSGVPLFQYWQDLGTNLVLHHETMQDGNMTVTPPRIVASEDWLTQASGTTWSETSVETLKDGEGSPQGVQTVTRSYTMLAPESLSVPAGTFDTIHLRYAITVDDQPGSATFEIWFAPGIGRVKLDVMQGANVVAETELTSYIVQ